MLIRYSLYRSYKSEQSWLKGAFIWRYVVLDEGQIVSNDLTLLEQSIHCIVFQVNFREHLTALKCFSISQIIKTMDPLSRLVLPNLGAARGGVVLSTYP